MCADHLIETERFRSRRGSRGWVYQRLGSARRPLARGVISGSPRGRRKRRGGPATRFVGGRGGRDPLGLHATARLALRCWRQPAAGVGVSDCRPASPTAHQDWVILVGTYFASFILADVTTTNMLGVDDIRVRKALHDGVPLWRLLLVKNVALLVIVGLPTLVVAMAMTLWTETPARLIVTIPTVAVPILSWIGIGNVTSVVLPVAAEPLICRWRQRRQLRITIAWVASLALPYALFYVAIPSMGYRTNSCGVRCLLLSDQYWATTAAASSTSELRWPCGSAELWSRSWWCRGAACGPLGPLILCDPGAGELASSREPESLTARDVSRRRRPTADFGLACARATQ